MDKVGIVYELHLLMLCHEVLCNCMFIYWRPIILNFAEIVFLKIIFKRMLC